MSEVLFGSILSALSTGAGALVILFIHQSITHRWKDVLLAFSAGIMMAAHYWFDTRSPEIWGLCVSLCRSQLGGMGVNTFGKEYSPS